MIVKLYKISILLPYIQIEWCLFVNHATAGLIQMRFATPAGSTILALTT